MDCKVITSETCVEPFVDDSNWDSDEVEEASRVNHGKVRTNSWDCSTPRPGKVSSRQWDLQSPRSVEDTETRVEPVHPPSSGWCLAEDTPAAARKPTVIRATEKHDRDSMSSESPSINSESRSQEGPDGKVQVVGTNASNGGNERLVAAVNEGDIEEIDLDDEELRCEGQGSSADFSQTQSSVRLEGAVWAMPSTPTTASKSTSEKDFCCIDAMPLSPRKVDSCPHINQPNTKMFKRSKSFGCSEKESLSLGEIGIPVTLPVGNEKETAEVQEKGYESPLSAVMSPGESYFRSYECHVVSVKRKDKQRVSQDSNEEEDDAVGMDKRAKCSEQDQAAAKPPPAGTNGSGNGLERLCEKATKNVESFLPQTMQCDSSELITESWVLLDCLGRTQQVSPKEVSILLGGHSLEIIVGKGPKADIRAAHSETAETPVPEPLFQDDKGGDEEGTESLGLERKTGNILLYITNSRRDIEHPSVRFFPVNNGLVNLWRRSKEFDRLHSLDSGDEDEEVEVENAPDDHHTHADSLRRASPSKKDMDVRIGNRSDRVHEESTPYNRRNLHSIRQELRAMQARAKELEGMLDEERRKSSCLSEENCRLKVLLDDRSRRASPARQETKAFGRAGRDFSSSSANEYSDSMDEDVVKIIQPDDDHTSRRKTNDYAKLKGHNRTGKPDYVLGEKSEAGVSLEGTDCGNRDTDHTARDVTRQVADRDPLAFDRPRKTCSELTSKWDNASKLSGEIPDIWLTGDEVSRRRNRPATRQVGPPRALEGAALEGAVGPAAGPSQGFDAPNSDRYYQMVAEVTSLTHQLDAVKLERDMILQAQSRDFETMRDMGLKLEEGKTKIKHLDDQLETLRNINSDITEKLACCRDAENKLKACEETVKKLNGEVAKKNKCLRSVSHEVVVLTKERTQLQASVESKDKAINQLQKANVKKKQEEMLVNQTLAAMNEKVALLQSEKDMIQCAEKERNDYVGRLEETVQNLQVELSDTKVQLIQVRKSLATAVSARQEIEGRYEKDSALHVELKSELETAQERLKVMNEHVKKSDEAKQLAEEQNEINRKHFEKSLQQERQRSDSLINDLEDIRSKFDTKMGEHLQKVSRITQEKDELFENGREMKRRLDVRVKEYDKLEGKYRKMKEECNERTTIIKFLEEKLNKSSKVHDYSVDTMKRALDSMSGKLASYKEYIDETQSRSVELAKEVETLVAQKKALEDDVSNYFLVVKRLKECIDEKDNRIRDLRNSLNEEAPRSKGEVDGWRADEDLRKVGAHSQQPGCRESVKYLEENEHLQQKICELRGEMDKYEVKIGVLSSNLSNCGRSISDLKTEQRRNECLTSQINELEAQLSSLRQTNSDQEKRLLAMKTIIEKCDAEMKGHQQENCKKLFSLGEQVTHFRSKLTDATRLEETLRGQLEWYRKERDDFLMKLEELQSSKDRLIAEKNRQINQLETVDNMKEQQQGKLIGKISGYRMQVALLNKKLKKKGQKLEELMSKIKMISEKEGNRISILRKSECALRKALVELRDDRRNDRFLIKELEGDLETAKTARAALEGMLAAARQAVDSCERSGDMTRQVSASITRLLDVGCLSSYQPFSTWRRLGSAASTAAA